MRPNTTDDCASAREAARRVDGRFGVQPLDEADLVTLTTVSASTCYPGEAAVQVVRQVEQVQAERRDDLRCAEIVSALDHDADRRGYDALRVAKLALQPIEDDDNHTRYQAVALSADDAALARFDVDGPVFAGHTVPASFSTTAAGYPCAVDVAAVRGHDWWATDVEYRERLVVTVLGEEYCLGVAVPW